MNTSIVSPGDARQEFFRLDNQVTEFFGKPVLISDERLRDAAVTYCIWLCVLLLCFSIIQSQSIMYKFRLVRMSKWYKKT
jgi:hypothetical protein